MKVRPAEQTGLRGATVAEFALVITVFIVLTGAFIDAAYILFRHSLITDSAATFTRQLAPLVARRANEQGLLSPTCNQYQEIVSNLSDSVCALLITRKVFSAGSVHGVSFEGARQGELFSHVRVETEANIDCLFCQFFGLTAIRTESQAMVESSNSGCGPSQISGTVAFTLTADGQCTQSG